MYALFFNYCICLFILTVACQNDRSKIGNNEEVSLKTYARKYVNDCLTDMLYEKDGYQYNSKGTNKYVPYGSNKKSDDEEEDCDEGGNSNGNNRNFHKRNAPQNRGNNNRGGNRNRGNNRNNCGENEDDSDEDDRRNSQGRRSGNNNNRRSGNNGRNNNNGREERNRYNNQQNPFGQEDFYYRAKRQGLMKAKSPTTPAPSATTEDDPQCLSQCVFGYMQIVSAHNPISIQFNKLF